MAVLSNSAAKKMSRRSFIGGSDARIILRMTSVNREELVVTNPILQ
jgi:hypothetical protein